MVSGVNATLIEGGACTERASASSSSGPGGGSVPPVPGLLGEGAPGSVREGLGPRRGAAAQAGHGVGLVHTSAPTEPLRSPDRGRPRRRSWTNMFRIRGTRTTRSTVTTS